MNQTQFPPSEAQSQVGMEGSHAGCLFSSALSPALPSLSPDGRMSKVVSADTEGDP